MTQIPSTPGFNLTGKTILIFGSGNLESQAAARMCSLGAQVIICMSSANCEVWNFPNGCCEHMRVLSYDVRKAQSISNIFEQLSAEDIYIDCLICMEDIPCTTPFPELSLDEIQNVHEINCRNAQLICTQAAMKMTARGGRIICLTSSRAFGRNILYQASKAYMAAFLQYLTAEYGKFGVVGNCVAVDSIRTDAYCLHVADLLGFLCSGYSQNIAGQEISVWK